MRKKVLRLATAMILSANIVMAAEVSENESAESEENVLPVLSTEENSQPVNIDTTIQPIENTEESVPLSGIIYTASNSDLCGGINNLNDAFACFYNVAQQDGSFNKNELEIIYLAATGDANAQAVLASTDPDLYAMYATEEDLEGLSAVSESSLEEFLNGKGSALLNGNGVALGSILFAAQNNLPVSEAVMAEAAQDLKVAQTMVTRYDWSLNNSPLPITNDRLQQINNGLNVFTSSAKNAIARLSNSKEFYSSTKDLAKLADGEAPASRAAIDLAKQNLQNFKSEVTNLQSAITNLRAMQSSALSNLSNAVGNGDTGVISSVEAVAQNAGTAIQNNKETIQKSGAIASAVEGVAATAGMSAVETALVLGGSVGALFGSAAWAGYSAYTSWSNNEEEFMSEKLDEIKYGDNPLD